MSTRKANNGWSREKCSSWVGTICLILLAVMGVKALISNINLFWALGMTVLLVIASIAIVASLWFNIVNMREKEPFMLKTFFIKSLNL